MRRQPILFKISVKSVIRSVLELVYLKKLPGLRCPFPPSVLMVLLACQILTNAQAQISSPDYDLTKYRPQAGLIAGVDKDTLNIQWEGEDQQELRLRFVVNNGIPVILDLALRRSGTGWLKILKDARPVFHIVSGLRRVTQQQTEPLEGLGIPLTAEKLNEIKWNAFWDAPLYISDEPPLSHESSIPAATPFANHPGMPRRAEEVQRVRAVFKVDSCEVQTNGARIEISFHGVKAGIFTGYLQFTVFKGSNLIRQMLIAKTERPSVAFKYNAGLEGLSIRNATKMVWRDLSRQWQNYQLGGPPDAKPTVVKSNNRLIAAELEQGAIAAFPPPHSFYWARESEQNLGYSWYQKDSTGSCAFGIRQAELEEDAEFYHNFALYNARPGTWQRMPLFLYVSPGNGRQAIDSALSFTRGDHFKPLPGYKVMGHHYHVGMVKRLQAMGGFDQRLNDISTMKALGVDIYSVIDGARGPGRKDTGELYLQDLAEYYEATRRQSDKDFLVMPSDENSTGGRRPFLGGHYDILPSKPLYWRPQRQAGQPLTETHPKYGTVYNLGTPADFMEMAERENVLVSMPHPDAKRSTGYPEAILDESHFQHPNYFGLGYRWGMGIDASAVRLGEYRFLPLWDETNNRLTKDGHLPKFALAISEARSDLGHRGKPPFDDAYGMSPVNYLQIDSIPTVEDMSAIIDALKTGKFFVTSGEVLIPYFELRGTGSEKTIVVDIEWTFPLDFMEIVWGDGETVDRQIIPTTNLPVFGQKRFELPFNTQGKKWVRFAAWDVAANGALVQPVCLPACN